MESRLALSGDAFAAPQEPTEVLPHDILALIHAGAPASQIVELINAYSNVPERPAPDLVVEAPPKTDLGTRVFGSPHDADGQSVDESVEPAGRHR